MTDPTEGRSPSRGVASAIAGMLDDAGLRAMPELVERIASFCTALRAEAAPRAAKDVALARTVCRICKNDGPAERCADCRAIAAVIEEAVRQERERHRAAVDSLETLVVALTLTKPGPSDKAVETAAEALLALKSSPTPEPPEDPSHD